MKKIVNAHTHLELTWAAHLCPGEEGQAFAGWVRNLIKNNIARRQLPNHEQQTVAAIESGIEQLLLAGTTHVGDISSTGLSIEPLLDSGLAGVVYIELVGLVPDAADYMWQQAMHLIDQFRRHERNDMRLGLTAHAIYSTRADMFQKVTEYCIKEKMPLCIHLAESPAEKEFAFHNRGPLQLLPKSMGMEVELPKIGGQTPVQYLAQLGVLEAKPLLVHMVEVTEHDLELVAQSGSKIVHCPRSNKLLRCNRMPIERIIAHKIPLALGTDSLSSSPSLDVREERIAAAIQHGTQVTAAQLQEMQANTAVLS